MQAGILALVTAMIGASAKHASYFDEFCVNIPNSYCVWDDPFNLPLWSIDDLGHWGVDNYLPPYVSHAMSAALAATFTLRFLGKHMNLPYGLQEYISAAHILLSLHNQQYDPGFWNCTSPNEFGYFAMYEVEDKYLYNDMDIYTGHDPSAWCDFPYFQNRYDNRDDDPRYNWRIEYFDDIGTPYEDIRDQFYWYGLQLGTIPYCPDIINGSAYFENDKYTCDPNTPGAQWGTVVYFGVRDDSDGIWYATYFMEASTTTNRLQWTRPSLHFDYELVTYFNFVWNGASRKGF